MQFDEPRQMRGPRISERERHRRRPQREVVSLVDLEVRERVDPRTDVGGCVPQQRVECGGDIACAIEVSVREDSYPHPSDLLMSKHRNARL